MWLNVAAKWNLMLKFKALPQLDVGPWIWAQDLHDQIQRSVCIGFAVSCKWAGCCGGERVNFCVCWFINYALYIYTHTGTYWCCESGDDCMPSLFGTLSCSISLSVFIITYIYISTFYLFLFFVFDTTPQGKTISKGYKGLSLCYIYAQVIV